MTVIQSECGKWCCLQLGQCCISAPCSMTPGPKGTLSRHSAVCWKHGRTRWEHLLCCNGCAAKTSIICKMLDGLQIVNRLWLWYRFEAVWSHSVFFQIHGYGWALSISTVHIICHGDRWNAWIILHISMGTETRCMPSNDLMYANTTRSSQWLFWCTPMTSDGSLISSAESRMHSSPSCLRWLRAVPMVQSSYWATILQSVCVT